MKIIIGLVAIGTFLAAPAFSQEHITLGGGISKKLGRGVLTNKPIKDVKSNEPVKSHEPIITVITISYRIDQIISDQGFISRKQKTSSWNRDQLNEGNREYFDNASVFILTTNTSYLVNGE